MDIMARGKVVVNLDCNLLIGQFVHLVGRDGMGKEGGGVSLV